MIDCFRHPAAVALAAAFARSGPALASSHMDAPLITLDDAANTTDVYAFVTRARRRAVPRRPRSPSTRSRSPASARTSTTSTTTCATRSTWRSATTWRSGRPTLSYQFEFQTRFKNQRHDPAVVPGRGAGRGRRGPEPDADVHGAADRPPQRASRTFLGTGVVPPNNQGNATPFYNQGDDGEQPGEGRRRDAGRRSTATPRRRSRRSRRATACSRASATTASTPTSSRSSTCCSLRSGDGLVRQPGRLQRAHDRARDPGRRARRRPAGRRRLRDHQPAAHDGAPHGAATVTRATSCRSAARATRSSARGSSRSRTRTATTARRPRRTRSSSRSTREPGARGADQRVVFGGTKVALETGPHRPARDLHPRPDQGRPVDRAGAARGRRRRPSDQSRRRTASRGSASSAATC